MSVVFLGIVGYLGSILYERAVAGDEAIDVALEPHAIYEYPVSMLLANAEGVEIEATVIGRSATHVQFISGGEEFVYPLDSLAKPVALGLVKYPVVGIQHAEVHLEAGALEVGDLYVLEMQKRVDQIDQEIKVLQRQYAVSVGRVAKRTIQREVEALRAEQGVLQQKISERREGVSRMKVFVCCILVCTSSFWAYENYGKNIPMQTALTHVDGRSVEVEVVSRSLTQVNFRRLSDGARFSCPIADLALWSKCKVLWNFTVESRATLPGRLSHDTVVGDLHLNGMQKMLVELQEDLSLLEYEFAAAETDAQRRTLLNEMEAVALKMRKIELKRAEHLSHSRP